LTPAQRDSGARKAAKPATSKPPRPLPSARKTESPPTQVAAAAPKSEAPAAAGPDAALARLTKEIQRVASQVLPQPAGASENNADLTTQVEVRYAEGGWVRSIVVGESSGSSELDEQALALARATRFPDVPEELRAREFSVRFPVIFKAVR
jgi:TonB family protein